ncbi:MAG: sigma-70 family RNA polymerase sigma factor [Kiritimatiellaeota bacterium]|nr:sigma-70 family RNA polymerase sigma factor [Kiritimatiellota bacterium]
MDKDLAILREYTQTRSAEAFADIVHRYAGVVYGTCLRITKNPHDAEDVSQECFRELAQKADSVKSSLAGWLHAAATNRSKDAIRAAIRRREREQQAVHGPSSTGEPTWEEVATLVDAALEELPDDLRAPLILHFLQGRNQSQVAEALGIDQSTVSRRLEAGVKVLRDRLRKAGVVVSVALLFSMLGANASAAIPGTLLAALGKMALAGVGQTAATASATVPTTFLGTAAGKLAVAAVAGAVVVGGLAVHKAVREPATSTTLTAEAHAAAKRLAGRVTLTGLARAIRPAAGTLNPSVAQATLTVAADGGEAVYYVYGWAGVILAKQADGKRAEVTGEVFEKDGRLTITGKSVDVKVIVVEEQPERK